ncbi:MAG: DUF2909 domain-containing protein [Clostridia bacterium]|nr:DUF2909 domain-containing protein [Clostridia bacterium]
MKIDAAVKFIIVLLVIMIVSLGAALLIMNNGDDGDKEKNPSVTTTAGDTTNPDSTSPDTTNPDTTTPDQSTTPGTTTTPDVTTTPEVTTDPDVTTGPDEIDPPVTPDKLLIEKSFKSDTGVALNLRADVTAYEQNGKAYLTVELYLEHYSISLKGRYDNVLTVDGEEYKFSTDAIKQEENQKGQTLLYTKTIEVESGDTVSVEAVFNSKVTYSGVKLDTIELADTVNIP